MANDFKITISAVDKATATVRKINESMAKMTRPVTDFQKSMNSLKDEIGMNTVVKGLKEVGSAAKGVAESVGKVAAPIAALLGVGTIAGIADLAIGWGKLGMNIANTAGVIGIGTDALQSLRGAASLAGLSTGDLDGSLQSIGNTLEGAQFGRNQDALLMMNRLGISVHRLANGSVDAERGLVDISRAMQGKNANVQGLIAGSFGVGALLPLLQKGPVAIAAYQAKIKQMGGIMGPEQIQSAADFQMQMQGMDISINNLKNSIGNALIPVLNPMVAKFSKWVDLNKDWIASDVSSGVEKIAEWLKKCNFDDATKGVKELGIAFAVITGVSFLSSLATLAIALSAIAAPLAGIVAGGAVLGMLFGHEGLNAGEDEELANRRKAGFSGAPSSNRAYIMGRYKQDGYTDVQAAGMVGSLMQESQLDPTATNSKTGAYGIGQWLAPRQKDFAKRYGHDIHGSTVEEQTGFSIWEMNNSEKPAGDRLRAAKSTDDAASIHGKYYERPKNEELFISKRQEYASRIATGMSGADGVGAPGSSGNGTTGVTVTVHLVNAPPGTTAHAKSDDGVSHVQSRIAYAMPTGAMP